MPITLNGTTGITTPAITNNGTLTQTGAATLSSTLQSASTIGVGGATPAASGAGITFPATASASSDANTLDDYEEGTWTPVDASGASLSFSNTSGNCIYTKVGRTVTASFRATYPSNANGSYAFIGGLPFTTSATTVAVQAVCFSEQNYGSDLMGSIQSGESRFILLGVSSGSIVLVTNSMLSTKDLRGSITYQASA